MHKQLSILGLLVSVGSLAAQSPLTTLFAGTNQAAPGSQIFFDLVVSTTVTIQALEANLSSAPGVTGSIEVYLTNPGVTTYYGNETNSSQWTSTPVTTGTIVAVGADQPSYVCLSPGLTLQPGTRGVALRHVDVQPWYTAGNGSAAPGGGGTGTNQTYINSELTLLGGAVQGVPWNAPTAPRVWNGSIHYAVGAVAHSCAGNVPYGKGCYLEQASFYQFFSTAPAASALSGRSISLLNNGVGYTVLNQPGLVYVAPSTSATALTPVDDGEQPYSWPSGLTFGPGGPTSLFVHSNGIVSIGGIGTLAPSSYRPNVPAMLDATATAWWSWHDYNPTSGGSGFIMCEEIAGVVYITWDNVESYPTAVVNPSKFQFQFELATGNVNYVWQTITSIGLGAYGDSHVIGFSPGGSNLDPGPTDLSSFAILSLTANDRAPLTLTASTRPALGSQVTYSTANPSAPSIGLCFLTFTDLGALSPAGFDLLVLGAPGCVANVDINQGVGTLISNLGSPLPSMDLSLSIPVNQSLVGNSIYAQSVWLDPVVNAAGLLTSNAIRSVIGTF